MSPLEQQRGPLAPDGFTLRTRLRTLAAYYRFAGLNETHDYLQRAADVITEQHMTIIDLQSQAMGLEYDL